MQARTRHPWGGCSVKSAEGTGSRRTTPLSYPPPQVEPPTTTGGIPATIEAVEKRKAEYKEKQEAAKRAPPPKPAAKDEPKEEPKEESKEEEPEAPAAAKEEEKPEANGKHEVSKRVGSGERWREQGQQEKGAGTGGSGIWREPDWDTTPASPRVGAL